MRFYLETRVLDVLPWWTREGCNVWRDGGFVPYDSEAAAREALRTRKYDAEIYDDPMWRTAEYRIVPARATRRRKP